MLRGQPWDVLIGLIDSLLQQLVAIALIEPRLYASSQGASALCRHNGNVCSRLHLLVILAHRCFMRGKLSLYLRSLIAGGTIEILVRVSELIGVELKLGFRNIEIAAVGGSRALFRRSRGVQLRSDALHLRLILFDELLKFRYFLGESQRLSFKSDVLSLQCGLAQRRGECLVYLMVGQPLSVARKFFLFGGDSERSKSLGRLPRTQIN